MAYVELTVSGYNGFAESQTIQFAVPDGNEGSGLTILVGPNNSGKSSIIESIHALLSGNQPTIPENSRNTATGRRVEINLRDDQGFVGGLRTKGKGGGATEWTHHLENPDGNKAVTLPAKKIPHPANYNEHIFVLPSRRYFSAQFGDSDGVERDKYMLQFPYPMQRIYGMQGFFQRIAKIQANRTAFDKVMGEVVNPVPRWHIDQVRGGNNESYVSVDVVSGTHDTDGLGEGILSLLFIIDSLYDSKPGQMIVIDEPELSLHPALQKRLARLFKRYAKDRQIVIATHSPYFVDWEALFSGALLARVINRRGRTQIYALPQNTIGALRGVSRDMNNPHALGLEAKEIFFCDEPVILVEGQDDVMFYPKVLGEIKSHIDAEFVGWGTGGAQKMKIFSQLLNDLGFERVIGLLDGDQHFEIESLHSEFPGYHYCAIAAEDIRTKPQRTLPPTTGLLDSSYKIRAEHFEGTKALFDEINTYLGQDSMEPRARVEQYERQLETLRSQLNKRGIRKVEKVATSESRGAVSGTVTEKAKGASTRKNPDTNILPFDRLVIASIARLDASGTDGVAAKSVFQYVTNLKPAISTTLLRIMAAYDKLDAIELVAAVDGNGWLTAKGRQYVVKNKLDMVSQMRTLVSQVAGGRARK